MIVTVVSTVLKDLQNSKVLMAPAINLQEATQKGIFVKMADILATLYGITQNAEGIQWEQGQVEDAIQHL